MRLIVAYATAGRKSLLPRVIEELRKQTRLPDAIYVCPAAEDDYDVAHNPDFPCAIHTVSGPRGLPAQRNAILRANHGSDLIVFFDDDFVPSSTFLAETEALFAREADIVMATGHVLADGINGPGIELEQAVSIVSQNTLDHMERLDDVFNAYGCNMVLRSAPAEAYAVFFDENLPLYGWWEDVDFSRRMAPYGRIVRSNRLQGVHMGSKSGRSPGQRLGYSQVANIVYMMQKGTIPTATGLIRISRNVVANALKQFSPEPWVDRRGRFLGNLKAIGDCLKEAADPGKATSL